MKISAKNILNLAVALSGHKQIEHIGLNLNFNELDSEDIKNICEALEGAKVKSLELSFKGCGLPRNAFKKLCIWLQLAIEVKDRLTLDFTLYPPLTQQPPRQERLHRARRSDHHFRRCEGAPTRL